MEKKKVGIWIRVSTIDQARGESPEHHEKRAKMYAEMKEWDVAEVYHLEAVSGKSVLEHPEARRMIYDIKRGHITGLIFSKIARLARNTKELIEMSELFNEYGADLVSLQESIDTSSPSGRFFYTMIAAMAQWEREEIADRVLASIPIRAQLGKSLGGVAPFGYMKDEKGKIVLCDAEAAIRKLMFELFLEHKKNQRVANILNERGYRTRNGAKFKHSTVDRLLRDPIAKGIRRMNYTKSQGKGKTWKVKPQEDWVFHEVPAIVDTELWDKVNGILEDSDTKREPRKRSTVHLFSGILKCSCGGMMYMRSRSPRYVCQDCKNKILPDDIEQVYKEEIKNFVFSDEEIRKQFDKDFQEVKVKENEIKGLRQKSDEIGKKIEGILDLFHTGELKKESFKSYHDPLELQRSQIHQRINEVQIELDRLQNSGASLDFFIQDMRNLSSFWDMMSHEEKHKTIQMTTADIIVSNETPDIEINMKYNPLSFENVSNSAHNHRGSCSLPA
ncbi:MAG: recombinase family protein [Chitinophagales bacterium]|nr:recombinase family protein [Chitinophagales bacterium]